MAKSNLSSDGRRASEVLRRLLGKQEKPSRLKGAMAFQKQDRPAGDIADVLEADVIDAVPPFTREIAVPRTAISVERPDTAVDRLKSLPEVTRPETQPIPVSSSVTEDQRLAIFLDGLCDRVKLNGAMVVDAVGRPVGSARFDEDNQSLASTAGILGQALRRTSQILSVPAFIGRLSLLDERQLYAMAVTVEGRAYTLLAETGKGRGYSAQLARFYDQLCREVELKTRKPQ